MLGVLFGLGLFLGEVPSIFKKRRFAFLEREKDISGCAEGRYVEGPVFRSFSVIYLNFDVILLSLIMSFEDSEDNLSTFLCFIMMQMEK